MHLNLMSQSLYPLSIYFLFIMHRKGRMVHTPSTELQGKYTNNMIIILFNIFLKDKYIEITLLSMIKEVID